MAFIYNAWLLRQLLQGFNLSMIGNTDITTRSYKETVTLCINFSVNFNVAIFFGQVNNGRNYCSDNYILVKAIAT